MSDSALRSVIVVLVEPQDPINIGATVRAMKNMGVSQLRLVNPAPYEPQRLLFVAHDADEIIAAIRHFDSLEEACADCIRVAGFTARHRSAKREIGTPRDSASSLMGAADGGNVALVFGREDRGLSNAELDISQVVIRIPTTDHASLNLAQAVLIALYELHLAVGDATRPILPSRKNAPPATAEEFQQFFATAARSLEEMDFFKTRFRAHVMRTLRSLAFRANPDGREISLLRAMAFEVMRAIERVRRP
jgi:tRNA/rRNA methyltransferase/tRNA (cytidine32/uridine32-2'-O)-methyltransferase